MQKKKIALVFILTFTLVFTQVASVFADDKDASDGQGVLLTAGEMLDAGEYKEGELLVTFDDNVSDKKIDNIVEKKDAETLQIIEAGEDEKLAQVQIEEDIAMDTAIRKFQSDPRVTNVQPNYRYHIESKDPFLSKDSKYYQYTNDAVKAEDAWTFLENGNQKAKTRVAVIDTGIDTKHEDLQTNFVEGFGKNKYPSVTGGEINEITGDSGEHGTHVSGIIGATYDNGKGGSGVASGHNNDLIEVMVVGASDDGENLYSADIIRALNYAADHGAEVINMSFGMYGRDLMQEKTLADLYYNKGIVLVAASGNEDYNGYCDPGSMKEVIGVNACAEKNQPSYYSNFGTYSDIMAPGSNIYSTTPGDEYSSFNGTSMASPVIAGIAGLMLDANPDLTPQQVYNIICASTGQNEFDANGTAYGLVDAKAAVEAAANASESEPVESFYMKDVNTGIDVFKGEDYCLETLIRPAASLAKVSWESSDESIATVDENGRVIGISKGDCTITAKAGDFVETCTVKVTEPVKVESIEIGEISENNVMAEGEWFYINAKVLPKKANVYGIYYESLDPEIVSVDEDGFVTAEKPGTGTIRVWTYETPSDYLKGDDPSIKKITAEATITVKKEAYKISIDKSPKWIQVGDAVKYTGKLTSKDGATGDEIAHNHITWSVNNRTLASIDSKGLLKAKKTGTVYVIADRDTASIGSSLPGYFINYYETEIMSATRKLFIAKKNYKGKADYALKAKSKKKAVVLTWKKNPVASGYEIQFSKKKSGKFKTIKKIKSGATKSITIKTKKTGYYRIRATYVKNGKTNRFGFSNIVKASPAKVK